MEIITSRTNPLIVRMAKLSERKNRDEERLFGVEGVKLFEEMQKAGIVPKYAFATENQSHLLSSLPTSTRGYLVSDGVYEKISSEKSPQGIFCAVEYLDKRHKFATIYGGDFQASVFCAERIRDPGNLGAILRSARAFGIGTVILSDDCADLYSPKTVRAAMGALFAVSTLRTPDMAATLKDLAGRGYKTFAAALDSTAVQLGALAVDEKTCFVVGNEGQGLTPDTMNACAHKVYIPMTGNCESLNASVASSLLMWEMVRGRFHIQ